MKRISILTTFFVALCFLNTPITAASQPQHRDITISLPAETVLYSLRKMLPVQFTANNSNSNSMEGTITVRSLDTLKIKGNTLSVHGVLEGKNVAVVTKVANQSIRLKLGQVTLPIACDMQTRFDAGSGTLYLTPTFPSKSNSGKSTPASLRPLLKSLAGKEYPINLDSLQLANIKLGDRNVPISMVPVDISGKDNTLVLKLQPKKTGK